ncbi:MAG: hypothetical protein LBL45_10930, partial [Treponema sp.]|nr:hypothetical protein [Treponema sp.]
TENVSKVTFDLSELTKNVNKVTTNVGGLNGSMGELVETLIASHLGEKVDVYGYNLKRIFHRVYIYDETNRRRGR